MHYFKNLFRIKFSFSKAVSGFSLLVTLICISTVAQANTTLPPNNLRINLLREGYNVPVNDSINLSWIFNDNDFNEVQTAYQVEIGTSSNEVFNSYTSGWINTSSSYKTIATVPPNTLQGNTLYYWRVKTKDKTGEESEWSSPSAFVTGMAGNGYTTDTNGWSNINGMWLGATPVLGWTDMTVEADLIIDETALGVSFRDSNSNYRYVWQFRASGIGTNPNTIIPHVANNGNLATTGTKVTLSNSGITLTAGTKFRAKIKITGTNPVTVTTWIDTTPDNGIDNYVQVDEQTMTSLVNTPGRFGFRTGSTESGKVDWVKITNGSTVIYENNFSSSTPMEFPGASISNGYLNVPRSQGNDCRYTPASTENNRFVFFRKTFNLNQAEYNNIEKAILAVTGRGTENNDLKSYYIDVFINGKSVGVGPARDPRNASGSSIGQYYNSFDVTQLLQSEANVLAAQAYSYSEKTVLFQLTLFHKDGTRSIFINSGADSNSWKAKDGTAAFGDNGEIFSAGGVIKQPYENINGVAYPSGWNDVNFVEDDSWRTPTGNISMNLSSTRPLKAYPAENILRLEKPAVSVNTITGSTGKKFQVIDLGKVIIGSLRLTINNPTENPIVLTVQQGESLIKSEDRTDVGSTTNYNAADAPYGTVRYDGWNNCPSYSETWTLKPGLNVLSSFLMKNFRYVQFVNSPITITPEMVTGLPTRQAFDETAAVIESNNTFIGRLVELCRYSIMATNQDIYTDSQLRERRAYEGDMILNQYNSYAVSDNYALARHTNQYLIDYPTWPPEYKLFSIEMAWADYLYTGDNSLLSRNYSKLQGKLPTATGTGNNNWNETMGMIVDNKSVESGGALVDWPAGEQDGYVRGTGTSYTTAYNAIAYGAYNDMANIAMLLGRNSDAATYRARATAIKTNLIAKLYNSNTGAFDDAITDANVKSGHYSQHATFYALAYGIYSDQAMADKMVTWLRNDIASRGLKPSVYGMYFLLRGLYNAGAGDLANSIMLQENPSVVRSWAHMLDVQQATITTEAWNPNNKPNMTYSHPWGGTPGTLITQGIFGIRPLEPNFNLFQIKFQPDGKLHTGSIKSPSQKGPILASFIANPVFKANVTIPANTRAIVSIPAGNLSQELENGSLVNIKVNGENMQATYNHGFLTIELGSGQYEIMPSPSLNDDSYTDVYIQLGDDPDNNIIKLTETILATLKYKMANGTIGTINGNNIITSDDATVNIIDNLITPISAGQTILKNTNNAIFDKLSPLFDAGRIVIPNPAFSEDFSSGNTFVTTWGSTSVTDGSLYVGTGSGTNKYYANGITWTDYTLLVNARAISGPISLTFRHNNNNFYFWQFFPQDNTLKKQKCTDGSFTMIDGSNVDTSPRTPIFGLNTNGQANKIMIAVEGNRIMSYVNDFLVDVTTDNTFSNGSVGIRTGNAATEPFYLDDVKVGARVLSTTKNIIIDNANSITELTIATGNMYTKNGILYFTSYPSGTSAFVYNLLGQIVTNVNDISQNSNIPLFPGNYIVKIQNKGKNIIRKVLVM